MLLEQIQQTNDIKKINPKVIRFLQRKSVSS